MHNIKLDTNYKYIIYLTENGCVTCNRTFGESIIQELNDPNALFVISASGTIVDISSFVSSPSKNIIIDDNYEFSKLKLLNKSGIIFLKDNNIDAVITLEANELADQIVYIYKRTHFPNKTYVHNHSCQK